MSEAQAKEFREKLIKEVYPELDIYLCEDTMAILARNLGVPLAMQTQNFAQRSG